MIKNTTENVHLSDEQTKQLQVFYTRLTNLQTETSIATKNLESLKQENIKIAMEKKYTEDTLAGIKTQIATLKEQADEHTKLVEESQKDLIAHRSERNQIDASHAKKHEELSKREKILADGESTYAKQASALISKSKELSEERLSVEKAKEAFTKATESVLWK